MSKINYMIAFLIIIIMVGCNNSQPTEENVLPEILSDPGELFLNKDQLSYANIEYGSMQTQRLSSDVNARGELILPVNAQADLVSLYPGIVKAVNAREGDKVEKGQVLAVLNSHEFIEAQQRYLMVKNQLGMLEQEYERQKELNKDKITSDKYYQKTMSDYNVARAELSGLALQLKMVGINIDVLNESTIMSELPIVSPLTGLLEQIDANPGKYIMIDESLMHVINRDELLVELNVFEKDIMKISPGQRVTFTLSNLGQEVYEAKVISVGNTVRKENRVVKVLAEFKNINGRMLPGMFVASEIHTGEEEVKALPEEAVLRVGNDSYVIFYTIPDLESDEGTLFISVPIKKGNEENGFIEVLLLEEIPANAMIVIKGGYYLKTELAKQQE